MGDFTKGKWEVRNLLSGFTIFAVNEGNREMVAKCFDNEADARLVAAAPVMYNMLLKILDDTQNGQFADENLLIALLNSIDGKNREMNYMYPIYETEEITLWLSEKLNVNRQN